MPERAEQAEHEAVAASLCSVHRQTEYVARENFILFPCICIENKRMRAVILHGDNLAWNLLDYRLDFSIPSLRTQDM